MLDRLWLPSGRLTAAEVVLQALVVQGKDGVYGVGHNASRRLSVSSLDGDLISCSPFRRILTVATYRTNYFSWLASAFRWSWASSVHHVMTYWNGGQVWSHWVGRGRDLEVSGNTIGRPVGRGRNSGCGQLRHGSLTIHACEIHIRSILERDTGPRERNTRMAHPQDASP